MTRTAAIQVGTILLVLAVVAVGVFYEIIRPFERQRDRM